MRRGSCAYFGGGPKLECYGTGNDLFSNFMTDVVLENLTLLQTVKPIHMTNVVDRVVTVVYFSALILYF